MYNISYRLCHRWVLACAAVLLLFAACKKTGSSGPVLTGVRYYAPAPDDTAMASLTPTGQWVVLEGRNLQNAVQILIDGVPASFNHALFSDTSAVVQLPSVIPFNSVAAGDANTIKYTTTSGSTTFSFNIVVPPPAITTISDEMANPGDSVWIRGANFFLISSINFAGADVTSYNVSEDGTTLAFVVPPLSGAGGPLSITTKSGTTATPFNVEDNTTGVLCNFDNVNTYQWWSAGTSNSSTDYPGNNGTYAILNTGGPLTNGDGSWWNGGRSINCNSAQWVPVSNLNDPMANWALKFEVSVTSPWNGSSIFLAHNGDWTYIARYEPWKGANGASPFKTSGWQTVTIPLTQFLSKPNGGKDGTGLMATDLTTLLGASGNGSINAYVMNDGSAPAATGLVVAIDNFRVVKVK